MEIGLAGTGRMGSAMAERLLALGRRLTVWNRTPAKTRALAERGARVAGSPEALAESCDVVLTVLTDEKAIGAAYHGPQGLLAGHVAGKLFIEMSTGRPHVEEALAGAVRSRGASLIDCPVGGSVGPAREGRLFGFAGGDAADVARAQPLLADLCRRLEHIGPVGAGARMKLAINLPLMVYWQALGEALSLCRPLELDPARLLDIFADTSGAPHLLKARAGAIADALAGKAAGAVTFSVDLVRKDLRTMIAEAGALGADLPMSRRALECFDEAAREGLGDADCAALPARFMRPR